MTEHLPALLMAWSIQLSGVATPGPSVALLLGVATAHGRGPALTMALGIGCASVVLALATVLGVAAIFARAAWAMEAVRILGAAYLAWLAWGAFRRAAAPPPLPRAGAVPPRPWGLALRGFALQVTNPKAMLFWLAIASLGGIGAAPPPVVALFVAVCFAISTLGHGAWAWALSAAPFRRAYAAARRPVEAALGLVFAGFALRLATARS